MSIKSMLPILGVGSAFAILGLAAARRQTHHLHSRERPAQGQRPSGVHPRIARDTTDGSSLHGVALDTALGDDATSPALTSDFWDAAPESGSLADVPSRPASEIEAYDALDTEDLTAEWLTRATEAPVGHDLGAFDLDDPAEIAADSISMISDASRRAAGLDLSELDADPTDLDEVNLDEAALDEAALDEAALDEIELGELDALDEDAADRRA